MSLDINQFNITHNLSSMWDAAGCYSALYESEGKLTGEVVGDLEQGLLWLLRNPAEARKHNAPNGWGLYEHAVPWLTQVIANFHEFPKERIEISK